MDEWFEIDFLPVETGKSGDAIALRYRSNGNTAVHVVDGGYTDTGKSVIEHIEKYYGGHGYIDNLVVTHVDSDHTRGLRYILENYYVANLWMLRPWLYSAQLIDRFATYNSIPHLENRLRRDYSNLVALEDIANERGIPILAPFQGSVIGRFTVLAPSYGRYLDLIVESERTPDEARDGTGLVDALWGGFQNIVERAATLVAGAWGHEVFSPNETSVENEMSVIQFARIANQTILLTGDAGREALSEAADYAPYAGLILPGIDRFQVPHHGSRRNVSTELLDRWLGPRLTYEASNFTAVCSSALADPHHPRPAVERAIRHRGGKFAATEGKVICTASTGAPQRAGWVAVAERPYPPHQDA